jgi:oxygen-dependent protoporphyrinogen oxidase
MSKTVIIGGGISGLATAYYLQNFAGADANYLLLESSSHLGGKITSDASDGFLVEGGPDSFLTQKSATLDLCRALGLGDQLIGSNQTAMPSTYVLSNGRLHPMPEGMMLMAPTMILPILRSRLISWPGKLRMGMEIFVRPGERDSDESLASFVRRRLGSELLDKIAGPLMAGIHAGDPERLSLRSTFPMFADMEQADGSLVLGMIKRKKAQAGSTTTGKRPSMFTTLTGGLQQLPDAIVGQLNPQQVGLNCRVQSLAFEGGQYRISLADGSSILADNVVCTTPAYVTADIVQQLDPSLAEKLRAIRYVSTSTVSLGFRRSELTCPLNGFGFIVPASEGRRINACTWTSTKFSNRAPGDCVLIRVFVGGALAEDLAEQDEAKLIELARQELREILGITATPVLAKAYRWHKSNPQYEVGHRARIAEIDHVVESHPGLYLAGAAYRGSGIPDCIQSGMDAALKITQLPATALRSTESKVLPVPVAS